MIALFLLFLTLVWNANSGVKGFSTSHNLPSSRRHDSALTMALPPIGPLCPFRTIELPNNDQPLEKGVAQEFAKIQSSMQLGQTPNPATLRSVADAMDRTIEGWVNLFVQLQSKPDFSSREYARFLETHLNVHGTSSQYITLLMSWQSDCLRALANNQPEPMPPAELDLEQMMKAASDDASKGSKPSISAMQAAQLVKALPLDANSKDLHTEFDELVQDHTKLLQQEGSNYTNLEPMEKLSFLDRIEQLEQRWESLLLQSKDSLNQTYINDCNEYLACIKLTEDEFRKLVKVTRRQMRQDAEQELS